MKKWLCMILVMCIAWVPVANSVSFSADIKINDWPIMKEAIKFEEAKDYKSALPYWIKLVDLYMNYNTESSCANGGLYAMKVGDYYTGKYDTSVFDPDKAVSYFEKAYQFYVKLGKLTGTTTNNWGYVTAQKKIDEYKSEVQLYVKKSLDETAPMTRPLAKFEPESGMMVGVYAENNQDLMKSHVVDADQFKSVYGKYPASMLFYNIYGSSTFMTNAAERMKKIGGSLQIHMQPFDLDEVKDDAYIREFARAAKASEIPIFLRFGGEMNGNWVSWGLQPEKYIEKFRLIHDIMAEEAPNVAMVWAPNFFPWDNMSQFYPGDAYVDWVGVSCYTTLTYTDDTKTSKLKINPIDLLSHIVADYGQRKPIMIVEGAVSYRSSLEPSVDYTNWAANNLERYFYYLPLVYPEIKAFYYYDANGAAGAKESYKLTENPILKSLYGEIIKGDYYLSKMDAGVSYTYEAVGTTIEKKRHSMSAYVKTFEPDISKVTIAINGLQVHSSGQIPYTFDYDFSKITGDKATIQVKAYLKNGALATTKEFKYTLIDPVIKVIYKDAVIRFDQSPVVVDNRTLVPMKNIFETLGLNVQFDTKTKTITASNADHKIILTIGDQEAIVNGKNVRLDVPASIMGGRTVVPLKFISQSLGLEVTYDPKTRMIVIQ